MCAFKASPRNLDRLEISRWSGGPGIDYRFNEMIEIPKMIIY